MSEAADLYDRDFVAWTEEQAARLRAAAAARVNADVDWANVAEEIESLGRSDLRQVRSRLTTIIEHLLKLQHSPALEPRPGWVATIARERREIEALLDESPSLRARLPELLARAARMGTADAVDALRARGEPGPSVDRAISWEVERILGDWLPETPA
ncbi:DUF29 domain-containing protein [Muricoccus radiodurans]|uniref:DUF29 domain-containing protein n=1 Tax=Muricoccus radiodurans TaxID=2231721 RepID=UPI003CF49E3E